MSIAQILTSIPAILTQLQVSLRALVPDFIKRSSAILFAENQLERSEAWLEYYSNQLAGLDLHDYAKEAELLRSIEIETNRINQLNSYISELRVTD